MRSFLHLAAMVAIVDQYSTPITWLPMKADFTVWKRTFVEFLHNLPFSIGLAVLCIDDPVVREDPAADQFVSVITTGQSEGTLMCVPINIHRAGMADAFYCLCVMAMMI